MVSNAITPGRVQAACGRSEVTVVYVPTRNFLPRGLFDTFAAYVNHRTAVQPHAATAQPRSRFSASWKTRQHSQLQGQTAPPKEEIDHSPPPKRYHRTSIGRRQNGWTPVYPRRHKRKTPTGPIVKARLLRTKTRFQSQTARCQKAVSLIFPTTPMFGIDTLVCCGVIELF